ncbi:MAG: hypothetical protein M1819_002482, partial [Sarea resinae]
MASNALTFEAGGLYILVSNIGAESYFHWGLYHALTPSDGLISHLINTPLTNHRWAYQSKHSSRVSHSLNLLVAVQVGVLEPVLWSALCDRLARISVSSSARHGHMTCRVWVKRALEELDDEGYIVLARSVDVVEDEAVLMARWN